jgi:ketosteroid isomerase-like protein
MKGASMSKDELSAALWRQYDRWWAALPAHDDVVLDAVLADDWLYVDQFGTVRDKPDYIALVKRAIRPDHSTVVVTLDARLVGATALAVGQYNVRGIIEGNEVDTQLRYTSVWREAAGEWRCHSQHTTEIRDAPW